MYQNIYFLYSQWSQKMSNTAKTVPFDAFGPYLPLTGLKYVKICISFIRINRKWYKIQQILCYLMSLNHNWGEIYQDMYFLCIVATDDVKYSKNCAI